MDHFIITGTSRGIGEGIAQALIDQNHHLVCVSRSDNPQLRKEAEKAGCSLDYHQQDLSDPAAAESWLEAILDSIGKEVQGRLVMIHNAGLLTPITLIGQPSEAASTQQSILLNLVSPMRMTEAFVRRTQALPIPKQVMIISSGAARNPYPGWSTYCSSKAGVEMFARCLAEEQSEQPHPVRVVSLAPGVIDTEMQSLIREQSEENFPHVQRFLDLKEQGQLKSPLETGKEIAAYLGRTEYGQQVVVDLRN